MQPPSSLLRPSGYFSTAFSSAFASHGSLAFTSTQHKQRCRRVERGAVPLAQARSRARSGNGGGQGNPSPLSTLTPHAANGCSASIHGNSGPGAARSETAKFSPPHHGQRSAAPPHPETGNTAPREPRYRRCGAPCRPPRPAPRPTRRGAYLPQHAGQTAPSAPRRGAALSRFSRCGHAGGAARLGKARLGSARPRDARSPSARRPHRAAERRHEAPAPSSGPLPPVGGGNSRGAGSRCGEGRPVEWPRGRARIRPWERRRSGASTPNAALVYL